MSRRARRAGRRLAYVLGVLCAALSLLGCGELYLCCYPSADLLPYLGDDYTARACFVRDEDLPFRYRSFEEFRDDNPRWWRSCCQLSRSPSGKWLFLGNSFGFELSDYIDRQAPFAPARANTLDGRDPLTVRLAQIQTLLESNYCPERIFLVLTPIDLLGLGEQPLATQHLNRHGALCYRPRLPPAPFASLVRHSRLALAAWARTGQHRGNPRFRVRHLSQQIEPSLREDLATLTAGLATVCRRHATPVTVIVIPMRKEICRNTVFPVEDIVIPLLRQAEMAAVDPRPLFLSHPQPEQLYVEDGHLSQLGNQLVVEAMKRQLRTEALVGTEIQR